MSHFLLCTPNFTGVKSGDCDPARPSHLRFSLQGPSRQPCRKFYNSRLAVVVYKVR
uniref:Uncharacterized protein n=1 Tax=Arundo donax TaxID=35708 RepID=A0A0A9A8K1_ARUDO